MAITTQMRTEVSQLYVALFGRAPDGDGLGFWVQLRDQGQSLAQIANTMYATTPARTYFPSFLTNSEIISAFYTNVLGRAADADGLAFWTGKLNATGATPGSVIAEMINVVANYTGTDTAGKDSQSLFNNKVTVAQYYGEKNGNVSGAQTALQSVTKDAASVTTTKAAIDAGTIGGVNQGQTFNATSVVDNIIGTSGNDTIGAVVADTTANGQTLSVADVIDGAGGTDVLNIIVATANALPAATVKNVEKITFKEVAAAGTHSLANVTGATQLWTTGSTEDVAVDGVQNNLTVGVENTAKNMTVDFKAGTFGASGAVLGLALNNAGTSTAARSTVTVGQATAAGTSTDGTLNIDATGSSFITLADGGKAIATDYKTVNVTGTGKLDLDVGAGILDNTTTVSAAANTGGVTLSLVGNAKDVTVTGGSGNDKVTLPGFNTKDVIDLGAGTDTLSVTLADAKAVNAVVSVKNTEVLEVTGGTGADGDTINADYFGVSSFTVAGAIAHNLTLTNVANAGTVTINDASGAAKAVTIDVKGAIAGTADSLTLTTDKDGADLHTQLITFNLGGVETLNVASSSATGAGAFTIGQINDAQLKTINISGTGDVLFPTALQAAAISSVDASTAGGAVTINLSNSTAAVTFKGGAKVDTYTASAKGDSIYGSAGADVVTLGNGADKLFYTAATQSTAAAKDVVGGFNAAADLVSFAASLQVGTAVYLGAGAFSTSAAKTQLRMNGADLEVDFNGDGTLDFVVTLTGQTSATFGAANFTFA